MLQVWRKEDVFFSIRGYVSCKPMAIGKHVLSEAVQYRELRATLLSKAKIHQKEAVPTDVLYAPRAHGANVAASAWRCSLLATFLRACVHID